jgi:hypothetical protein
MFKYERAAGSALRELAPASSFYAGGRKVKIEQVDMSLPMWRNGDSATSVPTWSGSAQRKNRGSAPGAAVRDSATWARRESFFE